MKALKFIYKKIKEFFGQCRYYDICDLASNDSTCKNNSGMYYGFNKPAGCYRKHQDNN